jgi:hypothetical protein
VQQREVQQNNFVLTEDRGVRRLQLSCEMNAYILVSLGVSKQKLKLLSSLQTVVQRLGPKYNMTRGGSDCRCVAEIQLKILFSNTQKTIVSASSSVTSRFQSISQF